MRIISGIGRGLKLASPPAKSRSIRPTSDRCREALFSILGDKVVDARILDLYAGTGAFGLEALSRGGQSAVFIDNSPTALKLLKVNVAAFNHRAQNVGVQPEATVIHHDLSKGFPRVLSDRAHDLPLFDIVFLDPPYEKGLSLKTLKLLNKERYTIKNGMIIAEERSHVDLPESFTGFDLYDRRRYGDTVFWMYSTK